MAGAAVSKTPRQQESHTSTAKITIESNTFQFSDLFCGDQN
jgi:hypothetical protein